jgi:hypothetical protein
MDTMKSGAKLMNGTQFRQLQHNNLVANKTKSVLGSFSSKNENEPGESKKHVPEIHRISNVSTSVTTKKQDIE